MAEHMFVGSNVLDIDLMQQLRMLRKHCCRKTSRFIRGVENWALWSRMKQLVQGNIQTVPL